MADFDPRNVTQVPDNMQAMIAEVEVGSKLVVCFVWLAIMIAI